MNISLIIPAHNEEKYLPGCLESVAPHAERLLEVIVIDNASTDHTAKVAGRFPFARVVHEPRKGLLWARQSGFLELRRQPVEGKGAVGYTVWGGNFVVSRSALAKIGGFNTGISFYGEDMDLARRLAPVGKVRFMMSFYAFTSGRRISQAGLVRTFSTYGVNFLWEVLFGKPFTKNHDNHR